ncbi:hypothetical protein MRB53_042375 [Persea americana]|nr:hypothetical protein MRB53_042375 [Persea americana]
MKILLVRHGESTGNRDHIWAGITDSELTVHGFEQAKRLAGYLVKLYNKADLRCVIASDLTRARRTAQALADGFKHDLEVTTLLREQDLGWREGLSFKDGDRTAPENAEKLKLQPGESKADMDVRADTFIKDYIQQYFDKDGFIIVVSHGLFLLRLYYRLATHLHINLPPNVAWSNTGGTTILIKPDGTAHVTDVNSTDHLKGLKRVRGVGSTQYDVKQQKVSDFFQGKRQKSVQNDEIDADTLAAIQAIDAACEMSAS